MAKKENKSNKEKKHFWKDFKVELKKVVWPTPKQLVNNTSVVVALVLITALVVFVLDLCFDSVSKYGITKLQTSLQSAVSENKENENTKSEDDKNNNVENETKNEEGTTTENTENNNVENTENNQETTESNE